MIRLQRPSLSAAAQVRLDARSKQLCELLASGDEIPKNLLSYYRTATEIKPKLRDSTYTKCMYCESMIGHVYFGDVEHILPVHHFPNLRLSYDNLGYCCAVCNNNKLDYYDPAAGLVDPYSDDPSDHIGSRGPSLRALSDIGHATITILELNRPELLLRRHDSFEQIDRLVIAYQGEADPNRKAILATQLRQEWRDSKEHSMVRKTHILSETGIAP